MCRLERFARYLGRREEEGEEDGDEDEDGRQEAAQVSSLSSVANRTGEKARPVPPLTAGAIVRGHICQSENNQIYNKG